MQRPQLPRVHRSALLFILFFFVISQATAFPTSISASSLKPRFYTPKPYTPPPPPIPPKCNPKCVPPAPPYNTDDPDIPEDPEVPDDDEILDNPRISNDSGKKEDKRGQTAGFIVGIVGAIVVVFGAGTCWENSRRKKKRVEQQRKEREREENSREGSAE